MPELPDVEGLRRLLEATAAGQRVCRVTVPAPAILRNTTPSRLGRALADGRLGQPRRHGKWLSVPVSGCCLLLHFGMDGGLTWVPEADLRSRRPGPYDRLLVRCDKGELRYGSVRKLGGVWLASGETQQRAVTGPLGPDALGLDRAALADRLAGRRSAIKPALMDQSVVAGLGNLTVDEILWRARLHPRTPAAAARQAAPLRRLHAALGDVLAGAVPAGRVPGGAGWLTGARDDPAARCPRCGTRLGRSRVAGRGTVWCPRCQPAP